MPGTTFEIAVTIVLPKGWVTYDVDQPHNSVLPTRIILEDSEIYASVETFHGRGASEEPSAAFNQRVVRFYPTSPTFRRGMLLSATAPAGERKIIGQIDFQLSNAETGRSYAIRNHRFETTLVVAERPVQVLKPNSEDPHPTPTAESQAVVPDPPIVPVEPKVLSATSILESSEPRAVPDEPKGVPEDKKTPLEPVVASVVASSKSIDVRPEHEPREPPDPRGNEGHFGQVANLVHLLASAKAAAREGTRLSDDPPADRPGEVRDPERLPVTLQPIANRVRNAKLDAASDPLAASLSNSGRPSATASATSQSAAPSGPKPPAIEFTLADTQWGLVPDPRADASYWRQSFEPSSPWLLASIVAFFLGVGVGIVSRHFVS